MNLIDDKKPHLSFENIFFLNAKGGKGLLASRLNFEDDSAIRNFFFN